MHELADEIVGFDHVAITVNDLDAACAFYTRLFAATMQVDYAPGGKSLVRQLKLGGALLSLHQAGNGVTLVAASPTVGSADICFRWRSGIDNAVALLEQQAVTMIAGPVARHTAQGVPSQSVYFRDPDGNLIELMAPEYPGR
jgi:catechol 2,3-dioxygenase-like lactoylglutathione lyase family enzyme